MGSVVCNLGRHTAESSVALAGNKHRWIVSHTILHSWLSLPRSTPVWITEGLQQASSHSVSCVLVPHIVCLRSLIFARLYHKRLQLFLLSSALLGIFCLYSAQMPRGGNGNRMAANAVRIAELNNQPSVKQDKHFLTSALVPTPNQHFALRERAARPARPRQNCRAPDCEQCLLLVPPSCRHQSARNDASLESNILGAGITLLVKDLSKIDGALRN